MVKQISDNEIYLLIKYIKSVLWGVAKRLSYIEDARCLKVNLFKSALHVSGDKFAHPQGHFVTIYSLWYNAPTLLPTGATVEMELKFHSLYHWL